MRKPLNFETKPPGRQLSEPKPRKNKIKRIAVIDAETDPFLYGRKPEVFAWGFYDGVIYQDFWGRHATAQLLQYLERIDEPLILYAHNGGKFDFFYLIEAGAVNNPVMIINGRVVKLGLGKHELRDSFAIIPVALAKYEKTKIDYDKFEANVRVKHKTEILEYLASDCENLYALVKAFVDRFGSMLTVGATAIKELGKLHPIKRGNEQHDMLFRPFYYGGRVSVFGPGITKGKFKIYDVNSMYPYVMKTFRHPYGQKYLALKHPTIDALGNIEGYPQRPYFAEINATNRNALPTRTKTGLSFNLDRGNFLACSHEIRVALKHRLLEIHKVNAAYLPMSLVKFDLFVDKFAAEKIAAKIAGDKVSELFAKFMLNSSYGKFGQNPAHYYDYYIKRWNELIPSPAWELCIDYEDWEIWRKPTPKPRFFDVAIAASITSAARAVLLDALCHATRPMYCDTDSVIAENLTMPLSETALGAWKIEGQGDKLAVAGKKLYALFQGQELIKMASKGADLEASDIVSLAKGMPVTFRRDAPTFKLGAPEIYIERTLRNTNKIENNA